MKRSLISTVALLFAVALLTSCAQKKEAAATTYSKGDQPGTTVPQEKPKN